MPMTRNRLNQILAILADGRELTTRQISDQSPDLTPVDVRRTIGASLRRFHRREVPPGPDARRVVLWSLAPAPGASPALKALAGGAGGGSPSVRVIHPRGIIVDKVDNDYRCR